MSKLTVKQQKFADEYIISGNATASYKKAGYSVKSDNAAAVEASKLLRNPKVKAYIDKRLAEIESKKIAKADEVLQTFTLILRQELTEEKVEINPLSGNFIKIQRKPSINEVVRAGQELMKRYPNDLELEKSKVELEKMKKELELVKIQLGEVEEEDDGFLEALEYAGEQTWQE